MRAIASLLVLVLLSPLAAAQCPHEALPAPPADVGHVEVDLTWMTACLGGQGHEERSTVGPVTVVTYECDDGGA